MKKIVLASNNKGKVKEFGELFAECDIKIIPQSHFKINEVEETGLSFVENAILKARNAAKESGLPAIADDSGIEVDALNGAPGIYSARFAGLDVSDKDNVTKLLEDLEGIHQSRRTARFQCIIVYMRHANDPTPLICTGTWEGSILDKPQGANGFGYDPIFCVPEKDCSAAELPADVKNHFSHRGKAIASLMKQLVYPVTH